MDGMNFIPQPEDDHHSVWQPRAFTGPEVRPSGLARLNFIGAYNDLDLTIMGVKEGGTPTRRPAGASAGWSRSWPPR